MKEEVGRESGDARHPHPRGPLLTRLRGLLDQALELGPAELEAFLGRLARDAPDDARELAALLAAEPELDAIRFLCDRPAPGPPARPGPASPQSGHTSEAAG
jgi:hypothetical protein